MDLAAQVREAIQETVGRILVNVDGTLDIEAKLEGLLGLDGPIASFGCRGRESNPHNRGEREGMCLRKRRS